MEYDAELVRRMLGKINDKPKRGKRSKKGGNLAALFSFGRAAATAATAARGATAAATGARAATAATAATRAATASRAATTAAAASRAAAPTSTALTIYSPQAARAAMAAQAASRAAPAATTASRAASAAAAAAPAAQAATWGSRAATAATALGTGLGIGYPIYGIIAADIQGRKDAQTAAAFAAQDARDRAQAATDRAQAESDRLEAERLSNKYETDYDNDRKAAREAERLARIREAQDAAAALEADRLQRLADARALQEYYDQQELLLAQQEERSARDQAALAAAISAAISGAMRGQTPNVPANVGTESTYNQNPNVPPSRPPAVPPSPTAPVSAPPRRRKGGMTGRIPETRPKPVKMVISRGVPADDPEAAEKSRAFNDELRRSIEEAAVKRAREDSISRYNQEQSDKMLRQNFKPAQESHYVLKPSSKPAPFFAKKKKGGNKPSLASLQSVLNQLGYYM